MQSVAIYLFENQTVKLFSVLIDHDFKLHKKHINYKIFQNNCVKIFFIKL